MIKFLNNHKENRIETRLSVSKIPFCAVKFALNKVQLLLRT